MTRLIEDENGNEFLEVNEDAPPSLTQAFSPYNIPILGAVFQDIAGFFVGSDPTEPEHTEENNLDM